MKSFYTLLLTLLVFGSTYAQTKIDSVFIKSDRGNIYGTLVCPESNKKVPVVLIIAGSGPTDRNGNNNFMLKSNTYKMLAEQLAAKGIASLRYDKWGVGQSLDTNFKETDLRFEDYINDAVTWINWLKKDKQFSEIIIAGHSEGSLIGMLAAQKSSVNRFISIAGLATPASITLKKQFKVITDTNLYHKVVKMIDTLASGKLLTNVPKNLYRIFRPSVQPYMVSWFKYNPTTAIAALKIPVLIIQGNTDIQVDTTQAYLLAKANPNAKLMIVEGMNHILKDAPADRAQNIKTYSDPNLPLNPVFAKAIINFIKN